MSARSKGRVRDVRRLLVDVGEWARLDEDVEALVLVGSYARGTERMGSDVDLVVLSPHFERLAKDLSWFTQLRRGSKLIRVKAWGPLLERRFRLHGGLHVELGLVSPAWAELPLDCGTRRVLADGSRVLYDKRGLLSRAQESISSADRP